MRYLTFAQPEPTNYEVCFLVPYLAANDIQRLYIDPYFTSDQASACLAYDLHKAPKRTPVVEQKEYLSDLLPLLSDLGVRMLVVGDAEYFKTLAKQPKAENTLGVVFPCAIPGYEHINVTYCPPFSTVFRDPARVEANIKIAITAAIDFLQGDYSAPGDDIIKFAEYPTNVDRIAYWLQRLLDEHTHLAADIEAFSLKHYSAGIGTISFAWSQHEGIAFPVDLQASPEDAQIIRGYLLEFFIEFARRAQVDGRRMIWHKIDYDVTVLIYQLFMDTIIDQEGLLHGLDVMLASWDCTRIITYLATNSTAGNNLGLKYQAREFAGDYAEEDIADIRAIPLDRLLTYNLKDSLSTWYVRNKNHPVLVSEDQKDLYEGLFKDAMVDIIQMQLTGLPLNRQNVLNVRSEFSAIQDAAIQAMRETDIVQSFLYEYRLDWIAKQNLKLKTIQRTMDDAIKAVEFNPNSPVQLGSILYGDDFLALPIIERTKKGQPAADKDTIKALLNHVTNEDHLQFMHALREFKEVNKMLTSFIPAMLEAPQGPDGWHYLFGSFNLGGTVSGRLSSSNPNLQNLPAKGKLAKLIKECFQAPEGWLFCGLDYASLEDRISALTTKDPNKLKVYTDGYDGHCLRAYSYFTDSMPDIDPTTVEGINAISSKYPDLRGNSKAPTFALTYRGTWRTLVKNCGFTPQLAQHIEAEYHKLYFVSDQWVEERIKQASQKGYIVGAFGLRVRTPLLARTVLGAKSTPYEAEAEGRTAGNALGQSWCLLNSRSSAAFMKRVRKSAYATDIRICAQIHDAAYFMIRALPGPIHFTNTHLVEEVNWNDHPDIYHPEVGLGGEFGIFYPSWAQEIVLPNGSTHNEIEKTINEIMCG